MQDPTSLVGLLPQGAAVVGVLIVVTYFLRAQRQTLEAHERSRRQYLVSIERMVASNSTITTLVIERLLSEREKPPPH